MTEVISMQNVKVTGQRSRSQRSKPNLAISGHMGPKINDLNPILSKNTRPVAAIKSLRFALFYHYVTSLG